MIPIGLMDILLFTLINAGACLAFPKLLSLLLASEAKTNQPASMDADSQPARVEVTSFPYCTTHTLTGNDLCKFRPKFCSRCSAY